MAAPQTKVDAGLVREFLKGVAAELGLYTPSKQEFVPDLESRPQYQANLEIVRQALKQGWSAKELKAHIWTCYKEGTRTALLSDLLPAKPPSKELDPQDDLFQEFPGPHYHPALFDFTTPMSSIVDGVVVPLGAGSKTAKARFSLEDLAQYYLAHVNTAFVVRRMNAIYGGLRYLASEFGLNETLYAIDLAGKDGRDHTVMELQDWMREARAAAEHLRKGEI